MLSFVNDYCECAHEAILNRLQEIRLQKNPGYGTDDYCSAAKEKIRAACACPEADVQFLVGGTQTNMIVIDTMLKSYEGVIACETGHVSVHEAGAIEGSGHKVLPLPMDPAPENTGKLRAEDVDRCVSRFYADGNYEHMVFPGMVYISHPTEYGTLYTKQELTALHEVCSRYGIPLYVDGARLAYALACAETGESDVTLPDLAALADVFYIGGTKCGALMGEAVVFTKNNTPDRFLTRIKQRGALLAKGWLLGLQFDTLFTDGLYVKLGKNAIDTARRLREGLRSKGYEFLLTSPTNQIMVVVENEKMAELAKQVNFSFWDNIDETHTAIRFCTSWGTDMADVERLTEIL